MVGFDNWEIVAEQTRPPLTTVDMNLKELGRQAGLALLRLVDGEAGGAGLWKLPCSLVRPRRPECRPIDAKRRTPDRGQHKSITGGELNMRC